MRKLRRRAVYSKGALNHVSRDETAMGHVDRVHVAAYQTRRPEYTSVTERSY